MTTITKWLIGLFWNQSVIGKWLTMNKVTGPIFAIQSQSDITSNKGLENIISSHPLELIYPSNSLLQINSGGNSMMADIIGGLLPLFYTMAATLMVFMIMFTAIKGMKAGATSDPRGTADFKKEIILQLVVAAFLASAPNMINLLLQMCGNLVLILKDIMLNIPISKSETMLDSALSLGYDAKTIDTLFNSSVSGGVFWTLVYFLTTFGLTIWIKFEYFLRGFAFLVAVVLSPIFIAGLAFPARAVRSKTMAFFTDLLGIIFIQPIHALVIFMMTVMLQTVNVTGMLAAKELVKSANYKVKAHAILNQDGTWHWYDAFLHPAKTVETFWHTGQSIYYEGAYFAGKLFGSSHSKMTAKDVKNLNSADNLGVYHLEGEITGFLILIMFQPLAKIIAGWFGINTNFLDSLRSHVAKTGMTAAAIAGTAAVTAATGTAAVLGGGGAAAGATAKMGASQLGQLGSSKFVKGMNPFQQANLRTGSTSKAMKAGQLAGVWGKASGQVAGGLMAAGGDGNPFTMMLASQGAGTIAGGVASILGLGSAELAKMGLRKHDPKKHTAAQHQQAKAEAKTSKTADRNTNKLLNDNNAGDTKAAQAFVDKQIGTGHQANLSSEAKDADSKDLATARKERKQGDLEDPEGFVTAGESGNLAAQALGQFQNGRDYDQRQKHSLDNQPQFRNDPQAMKDKRWGIKRKDRKYVQDKAAAIGFNLQHYDDQQAADYRNEALSQNPDLSDNQINSAFDKIKRSPEYFEKRNAAMDNMQSAMTSQVQQASEMLGASTTSKTMPVDTDAVMAAGEKAVSTFDQQQRSNFIARAGGDVAAGNADFEAFKDTPTYAKAIESVQSAAQKDAFVNSNGVVTDHVDQTDNPAFSNSRVNKRRLVQQVRNNMLANHATPAMASAVSDSINQAEAAPLVATLSNGNKIFNNELGDQLNSQWSGEATTPNNSFGTLSTPKPDTDDAGYQAYYQQALNNDANFGTNSILQSELNRNQTISDLASSLGPNAQATLIRAADQVNPFTQAAEKNVMEVGQLANAVNRNSKGEIAPHALQLVTDNNHARIVATLANGTKRTVSHFGTGLSSLKGGQEVIQDLDLNNGYLSPKVDRQTHQASLPYISDLTGGRHPIDYTPDYDINSLMSLNSGQGAVGNPLFTLPESPANGKVDSGEFYLDDLLATNKYSNFALEGNRSKSFISAVNNATGQTVRVSPIRAGFGNLDNGLNFSQPLSASGGEISIKPESPTLLTTNGQPYSNKMRDLVNRIMDSAAKGTDGYNIDGYIRPSKPNERNYYADHHNNQSITNLEL